MSKAVGQIALIGAAIALNFVPGAGFALGTLLKAGTAIGGAIFDAVVLATTIAGVQAALTGVSGLLGLGPKAQPADSTISTVKNPTPVRAKGYGRRRMFGAKIFFETSSAGASGDAYAFADGEADGVEQIYLNDRKVTVVGGNVQTLPDNAYQSNHVKVGFSLGATPGTAFSELISRFPGLWTSNHRGDGVVTGYMVKLPEKQRSLATTYPQGDFVELSAVFRLTKNIFDPRTGLTGWTENPVLHLLNYLLEERGYDYNTRILPTEQYWIDAANICDEAISLKAGGAEPRYRGCVTYNASAQPKEVIASLLEVFDGWIAPRGDGALIVYAGKLYAPTVTLGPDEIINYNLPYGVANENRVDELIVSYVSAAHDYNVVETTPWGVPGIKTDAFGPQSPSYSQNRRLAKRAYSRINEFNRGSIVTNLGGRVARGHRYINLNIEESGMVFFSGLVEIVGVKRDFTAGGLAIDWVAVDENIDAWNPATEEGDPAALGDRIAPAPLDAPTIASAVAFYGASTDGGTGARVRIEVATPAQREDYTWFARWKRTVDSAWNESRYPDTGSGTVVLETGFVSTTDDVEVQVSYAQGDGRASPWSASAIVDARTDAEPPGDATVPVILDWRTILRIEVARVERASSYVWRVYRDDGTTLVRTIYTTGTVMEYTPGQAATDGIRRSYVVTVAGANAAGEGATATTGVITNAAPPQVTGLVATGGDYIASLEFDAITTDPDLVGYALFYSLTDGFNPTTQGFAELRGGATTQELFTLAAGTYYVRVAGYDGWTNNPSYLNLSDQESFVIAIGTQGGTGGGGDGGGGPGGGGPPVVDEPI